MSTHSYSTRERAPHPVPLYRTLAEINAGVRIHHVLTRRTRNGGFIARPAGAPGAHQQPLADRTSAYRQGATA
ncbi:MAG TPA: hypothetical protein VHK69_02980 [Chitinophagaceae bacterium]|jgi:hypothetical protein|nr:hypothetical protein [Chitinophagaceae bacterium]